jgi:mono/diheme cytochrome c family protein
MKGACCCVLFFFVAALLATGYQNNSKQFESPDAVLARIPDKAGLRRNPLANDPDAARAGSKLFEEHCAECHGDNATGSKRGPNLRASGIHDMQPGQVFWILSNGIVRHGMPAWSKLPEPQRWQIVSFLQTLDAAPER